MRMLMTFSFALAGLLAASLAGGAQWSCERVETEAMVGPEDVALDPSITPAKRLLISSMDRRMGREELDGAIFALELGKAEALPIELPRKENEKDPACSFRPHGMAAIQGDGGVARLYVINHHDRRDFRKGSGCGRWRDEGFRRLMQHSIEVYRIREDHLEFEKRLTDPLLAHPNDLAVLPNGEIFAGNSPPSALSGMLNLFFGIGSNVVHYRDGDWHVAAHGIRYANGVAARGASVIVAETTGRQLSLFETRDHEHSEPPCLREVVRRLALRGAPDNLSWTADGALLVAIHDDLSAFLRHAGDARAGRDHPAPSPPLPGDGGHR